jgi:hypothetical protein
MPNADGTLTIDEALAGDQSSMPKTLSIDEALMGPNPNMGPAPQKFANVGGHPIPIDYEHGGLQRGEREFLANFGGNAKMQAAFLKSRGYQTTYHPDTGELLVVNQDGKARPLQGPADFADPLNYAMDAATMWMAGGGGKAGTMIGERLLPGAMQNFLTTMLPGQVLGVAGARTLQQGIGQSQGANQINPAQIGKEAVANYGLGALTYGGAQLFGQGGGVPAGQVDASVQNPALLKRPPADAERTLSENLAANTEQQAAKTTLGHQVYQNRYLDPLKNATLDVKPYVDALRGTISEQGDVPALRVADKAIEAVAQRLEARASLSGGRMTAGELDSWIRENLTDPLHGSYSRGSEAIMSNRLMEARTKMTDALYSSLGPGASSAQKLAESSMSKREAVEKTFPAFDKSGKVPVATGAERLRMVNDPGPQGQTLRQILTAYDAEHGTTFMQQASNLGTKQLWNAADRVKAQVIDNALKPQYLRLGVIKQGSRMIGKQAARLAHHAVPATGGIRGMVDNHPKRVQEEQQEPAPEQMFPGTTNAPAQEQP